MVVVDNKTMLEVLGQAECWQLLRRGGLGRVGVIVAGHAEIFPVNYAVDGTDIVFRTAPGSKMRAAVNGGEISFQIDEADTPIHKGWAVMVIGQAEEVIDPESIERYEGLAVEPWATQHTPHWVRIVTRTTSGRRICDDSRRFAYPGEPAGTPRVASPVALEP